LALKQQQQRAFEREQAETKHRRAAEEAEAFRAQREAQKSRDAEGLNLEENKVFFAYRYFFLTTGFFCLLKTTSA
jgi:hypothetical protein